MEELDAMNCLVNGELLGVHDTRGWKINSKHTQILKKSGGRQRPTVIKFYYIGKSSSFNGLVFWVWVVVLFFFLIENEM